VSVADLVFHLRKLDIRLSAEGDRLRVNAPKGVLTESVRGQIAERKQELLDFLRDNSAPTALNPPPVVRRMHADPAPLSFAQERIWFLEQLEPGNAVYNICRAWRLLGKLNLSTMESSLNEIMRRHEVVRSSIRVADGQPVQAVQPPFELNLSVIDLQATSPIRRDSEIRRRIQQAADARFDFAAGKFLRAELLRVADDEHVLILATHHIVSDAWSMGILTRELWSLYETWGAGRSSQLEELPVQYADFAVWQRDWFRGEVLESQLSYWKEQLNDLPILNLPTDRPRPSRQSFHGARVPIALAEPLSAAINELSAQCAVTPFMTLLAAFQVLLYRYSGQDDIVVGSPVANRSRSELESLIGFFVNTLVLRSNLSGEPNFREFLLRVRDVCLSAYAHQDLPFEKLVQELQPERDYSRNPLFQVMFVVQNTPRPFPQPSGFSVERVDVLTATSPFDLSLYLRERDGKLIGFVEYSTDLFDSSTMERMVGHFRTLLEGIVADPDRLISTLPLLTEEEKHRLLVEWNDTAADYPKDSCIHELFEAQVERTPKAIAVQFEGKQLTYRELDSRANQLAHYLQGFGVGLEKLVGICVERSLEMVIGLFGILKAGGAYVPLDPAYPRERLEFMLKDAQVSVLLTQAKLVEDRGWRPVRSPSTKLRINSVEGMEAGDPRSSILNSRLTVVCLDRDWPLIAQKSDNNLGIHSNNLAYVIYTSGSTGIPKGVCGLHRGAVNRFAWMWKVYPFQPNEMGCIKTSLSFVDSVWEVFGPLLNGIPSTIIPDQVIKEPQLLIRMLADNHVTRIVLVPSLLKGILDLDPDLQNHLPDLKLWISSGEPLSRELAERFRRCLPNSTLLNLYGSSEVSADATCYETRKTESSGGISIGRPIHNTQVYLLDSHLQPVPIGISGEICIGGVGLAREYLNQPQLTAERFIPNSFSGELESRLYRTGDLARYHSNGNIEFLGRVDNQVKIRGYRIELGEIETVLNQHPSVKESVVIVSSFSRPRRGRIKVGVTPLTNSVREETPLSLPLRLRSGQAFPVEGEGVLESDRNLIAYLVSNTEKPLATELRSFLKEKLPEYMIPSLFVSLDALPLTPNGKIDRAKLQPPDDGRWQVTHEFVAPRTEIEELVAQVWKEVLKLEKVGVHDNFFELGGHSLLGTQVVTRLRGAVCRQIPLRALFEAPTVAQFALKIERIMQGRRFRELPPLVPVSRNGYLPASPAQEQFWIVDELLPGTELLNMPYAYRIVGSLDATVLHKSLQEVVNRHEALRTVFSEVNGRLAQVVFKTPRIKLRVADLSHLAASKREKQAIRLSRRDASAHFDLEKGPLLRTKLIRLTENEHILLVTMHHMIADQWSMGVFRNDLAALYDAFSCGRPSPFADLRIQFADFVSWQQQVLRRGLLRNQIAYWQRRLAGTLSMLEFQKDRRKERSVGFRTSRRGLEFDPTFFADISALARRESSTPFMIMLTALNILLHRFTGQRDIRIGTLAANRSLEETEKVIGYFVNTVIVCTRVPPHWTFRRLLRRVQKNALEAFAHQDIPIEELESALEKKRKTGRRPLFQVLFNYRNLAFQSRHVSGLTFAPWVGQNRMAHPGITISMLDLMIELRETSTRLTGAVVYKTDIFSEQLIGQMIDNFHVILARANLQLDCRVSNISIDGTARESKVNSSRTISP
jgi:amino acid adenylation domain-containing protein